MDIKDLCICFFLSYFIALFFNYQTMKATIVLAIIFLGTGILSASSQGIPTYPIPSYSVLVNGITNFENTFSQKDSCNNLKGKRDAHIHLNSSSLGNEDCSATVWVYSLDQTTVLGPFQVNCGETLVVEIDEREWGVIVKSNSEVIVDVWFD